MTSALKRMREARETIRIYCDAGTHQTSIIAIKNQLKDLPYKLKTITAGQLLQKDWEAKTVALIMGGGSCSEWDTSLGQEGIRKIRQYVTNGGKYLGICAGAYFAAAYSIFQQQDREDIIKERSLGFFPGVASGPLTTTAHHLSPKSALAVRIKLLAKSGLCYYLGGCSFNTVEEERGIKVLARYKRPYQGNAIVSCQVNKGKAVLCGPHPEFPWDNTLTVTPEINHLKRMLSSEETFRQEIWQVMLQELL